LLVSQDAGPCAEYDKYYSQIFSLVPSDFDKLILATLLQGNISVLNSIMCHQRYQANAEYHIKKKEQYGPLFHT
jgi:hypothetical protein